MGYTISFEAYQGLVCKVVSVTFYKCEVYSFLFVVVVVVEPLYATFRKDRTEPPTRQKLTRKCN